MSPALKGMQAARPHSRSVQVGKRICCELCVPLLIAQQACCLLFAVAGLARSLLPCRGTSEMLMAHAGVAGKIGELQSAAEDAVENVLADQVIQVMRRTPRPGLAP